MLLVFFVPALIAGFGPGQPDPTDSARPPFAEAEVVVEKLDVLDRPDIKGLATNRLRRGDRVSVMPDGNRSIARGWVAIEPPQGSFTWIEQAALDPPKNGQSRVAIDRAPTRPGSPSALWPGAAQFLVKQDMMVQYIDRPPLWLKKEGQSRAWLAIEPPPGEVRYLPRSAVRIVREINRDDPIADVPNPSDESKQEQEFLATKAPLPSGFAASLAVIDNRRRSEQRRPVEQWRLEPILRDYQELLDRAPDSTSVSAVNARIKQTEHELGLVRSAKSFKELLDQSRGRDSSIVKDKEKLERKERDQPTPYDAQGLLQPTAKMVDGQKSYALISHDGSVAAFLLIPVGVNPSPLVSHNVGVHGTVHFDEDLRSKLIDVREIELVE